MGTNYYLRSERCEHCGRSDEARHIGKSSAGWCFSLHVDDTIRTLDDWKREWSRPGVEIYNEYGDVVSAEDMLATITERSFPRTTQQQGQWYLDNGAEPGPNGLARHRIGPYCVGHGEGTWDLIPGEFS